MIERWKKYLLRTVRSLMAFATIVIIILAILISLARIFTPILNQHKNDFEKKASVFLKKPIQIESVSATFADFEPVFVFKNVTIVISDKESITVPRLSVGINILQSLLHWNFVTGHITVGGLNLKVNLQKDGILKIYLDQTLIAEKDTNQINSDDSLLQSDIATWLLIQNRLALRNIDIEWSRYGKEDIHLRDLDAILVNSGMVHKLRGDAYVGADNLSRITIGADLTGNIADTQNLKANVYFSGENLPIGEWFAIQQYKNFKISGGWGNIKVWADWSNKSLQQVQTDFTITNTVVSFPQIIKPLTISHISANVVWQNKGNQAWSVWADDIDFMINDHAWPKDSIGVEYDPTSHVQSLAIKYLDLHDVKELLLYGHVFSDENKKLLTSLQPNGDINNINILHQGEIGKDLHVSPEKLLDELYFSADFSNVGMSAYQQYPGLNGFSGHIVVIPKAGELTLQAKNIDLNMPMVFNNLLPLKKFTAAISWHNNSKKWRFKINSLEAKSDLLNLTGQATVNFENLQAIPNISALFHISETDLSKIPQVLPSKVMSSSLSDWLRQAFISGKSIDGTVVYRGALNGMPFNQHQGVFIADSTIKQLTLSYGQKWPVIKDIDLNLVFKNNNMNIESNNGKVLDADIKHVAVSIPMLSGTHQPVLTVSGQLAADSQTALQFVANSPLDNALSGLRLLQLSGPMTLDLNLLIALSDNGPEDKVKGTVVFNNNILTMPSQKLTMKDVSGQLIFTDKGVSADKITANFFGYPTTIQMKTVVVKNKPSITYATINSHLTQKILVDYFNLPILNYFAGETDYNAVLAIQNNVDPTLTINTVLNGMQLNFPAPYNKLPNASTPLNVSAQFGSNHKTQLHINYNNSLDMALTLLTNGDKTTLYSGQLSLGRGKSQIQNQPGFVISGKIPVFDWTIWQPYIKTIQGNTSQQSAAQNSNQKFLRDIDVKIGELDAFKQSLKKVTLSVKAQAKAWAINISSDKLIGTMTYPDDVKHNYIVGDFQKAYLASMADKDSKPFDPSTIPYLDIQIKDFSYGDLKLQALHFKAIPVDNHFEKGMQVEKLDLENQGLRFATSGSWLIRNNVNTTHIIGAVNISDLGQSLNDWNITDKFISGSGIVNFDLTWPDIPLNFKLKNSKGSSNFSLSNGRIVDLGKGTESKIGIGKMINALSVDSLLHFEDIGKGGYSYSTFKADITIDNGQMKTNNAKFSGPVADIGIQGGIDLIKEQYNLLLKVQPHLTSSLPILAGVLINPLVGAIAWVADKVIVSPSVNTIVAVNYVVTGPFSNPDIQKMADANKNQVQK